MGIVSTRERIGTVRIEKKQRSQPDRLTFAEIAAILDGQVLGGASGLDKTLQKFVIGAMKLEAMLAYIDADSLLICGQPRGCAPLCTGGGELYPLLVGLARARK